MSTVTKLKAKEEINKILKLVEEIKLDLDRWEVANHGKINKYYLIIESKYLGILSRGIEHNPSWRS